MSPFINLLPWRQQQRLRQRRRWSFITVGCLVSMVLGSIVLPNLIAWRYDQQHLQHTYLLQIDSGLQRKFQQAKALKKRQQLQEKVNARQQAFNVWEGRLTALARQLPDSVWFTSLALKKDHLLIKGYAMQVADIQFLEKSLHRLDGKTDVKAGAIQQESKGLMRFIFTVKFSEATYVLPG